MHWPVIAGSTQKGSGDNLRLVHRIEGFKSFLLFDIVEERKRNAGGACPGGSSG